MLDGYSETGLYVIKFIAFLLVQDLKRSFRVYHLKKFQHNRFYLSFLYLRLFLVNLNYFKKTFSKVFAFKRLSRYFLSSFFEKSL